MMEEIELMKSEEWVEGIRYLEDKPEFRTLENVFTHMLIECVPESYIPATPLLGMCIGGYGCAKEGTMIKEFYNKRFGLNNSGIWIACADIIERSGEIVKSYIVEDGRIVPKTEPRREIDRGYDLELNGFEGDARLPTPYWHSFKRFNGRFGQKRFKADHIHFNYPNPRDDENLVHLLAKAQEYIRVGGILTVITSDFMCSDLPPMNYIRGELAQDPDFQVTPMHRYEIKDSELGTFGIFTVLKTK